MFKKRDKKAKIIIPEAIKEDDEAIEQAPVKKTKIEIPSESLFSYSDDIGLKSYGDGGVTKIRDSEHETINQALKQKDISNKIYSGDIDSSLYRGQKGYALYAEKSDATILASKHTGSLGPVKAPIHVRTTCRFDYAYGLCKD